MDFIDFLISNYGSNLHFNSSQMASKFSKVSHSGGNPNIKLDEFADKVQDNSYCCSKCMIADFTTIAEGSFRFYKENPYKSVNEIRLALIWGAIAKKNKAKAVLFLDKFKEFVVETTNSMMFDKEHETIVLDEEGKEIKGEQGLLYLCEQTQIEITNLEFMISLL